MKILLLGEYSNVHHTLCQALRRQGHEVLLISDGDGWKNYPRDIDLRRRMHGPIGSLLYLAQLLFLLPRLQGFDAVQLINPIFLDVKPRWNYWMTAYLKRHNRILSLGSMGDDTQVITRMREPDFLTYTDFYASGHGVIDHPLNRQRIATWTADAGRCRCSSFCAKEVATIFAGLYEYYKAYDTAEYRSKLHYLPLPIDVTTNPSETEHRRLERNDLHDKPVRVLLAVQKQRGIMKGTDQIEPLLLRLAKEHPDKIDLHRIESVPFAQYCREVDEAEVVVDQLYSYTPAMGALESMRRGKVVISGFEPEYAEFLSQDTGEEVRSGIINLRPFDDEQNYSILEETLLDRNRIAQLSADSQAFVRKYHDADRVAKLFVETLRAQSSLASSSRFSHK